MRIEKSEWLVIGLFAAFGIVWSLLIIPFFSQDAWFASLNPLFQYLLYNIGIMMIFIGLIGAPLAHILDKESGLVEMIKDGLASFTLFAVLDLFQPPLAYDWAGNILITAQAALPGTAIDRVAGFLWGGLGISGTPLFYAVYLVSPLILVIAAAFIFKPSTFIKKMTR